MAHKYLLLMAGGSGQRAGGRMPKQMQLVAEVPMLLWSIRAFLHADPSTRIVLVLNSSCLDSWEQIAKQYPECRNIDVCPGGSSRSLSVKAGLQFLEKKFGDDAEALVAVHDAARPMITPDVINDGWLTALQQQSAIPVVPETSSLRYVDADESCALDRSHYVIVQTPQIFRLSDLIDAYSRVLSPAFTDDASVYEAAGHEVSLYQGSYENFKVTTPVDFVLADAVLSSRGDPDA